MTPQERIKADAEAYIKSYPDEGTEWAAYIAGATAENSRAKVLVDALEEIERRIKIGKAGASYQIEMIRPVVIKALKQWRGKEEIELFCMVCGTKFMGPEPQMCCSGRDCGCMGLPIEPIVCSKECYNKGIPPQKGSAGEIPVSL